MTDFKKTIQIDHSLCIGCGLCSSLAPKTFSQNKDQKAVLTNKRDQEEDILNAQKSCPVGAIKIKA
jgi:ferredoxin